MTAAIRQLCALAIFCGLILSLTPKGGVRRLCSLCCTLVMLLTLLRAFSGSEDLRLPGEIAEYRELGRQLAADAEERSERMKRRRMEEECSACIRERAAQLGCPVQVEELRLRWDDGGFWVPESVTIRAKLNDKQQSELQIWIEAELGIERQKQSWVAPYG